MMMVLVLLTAHSPRMTLIAVCSCAVSSTLQRNTKEYGKKFMFDGCGDTCWNSDQGEAQHVAVKFGDRAHVRKLRIQVRIDPGYVRLSESSIC